MPKITFSHNFLWVNFRRNFTFLLGLCLSIFIFNFNSATVFAVQTPTLSVSVDNAAVNVNGNQVINSVNGTTELPLNLTINTTNKTGYTATLNTETNETALVNSGSTNGAKIDSITGASSILSLPVNTWGFKTSNEINYNPIPSLATPTNIFQTTEKTNGNDVRGLNIGMKLGQNIESGSYDNKLIFSVVTNSYAGKAVMTEGPDFNTKLKALETATNKIEHFKKSAVAPAISMNVVNIEDEESDYEIKLWLDPTDKTAYCYTEAEKVYLNKNANHMFVYMFNLTTINLSNFDTSQVTDMGYMFSSIRNLTTIDLSNFDTSKVTNMDCMFSHASNLTTLNLSSFDTSQVTNMRVMFSDMRNLTILDLSSFDTSKVTNMIAMFYGMSNLTTLNISSFDTSKVINMNSMFINVSNLTTLNLSSFDTSKVTDMHSMFSNMSNLTTLDLSSFDTSKVTNMSEMFSGTRNLTTLDLSNFNTSQVTDMRGMFSLDVGDKLMDKLEKIYVNNDFDTTKLTYFSDMFENRKKLRGGNGSYLADPSTADKSWLRVDRPGVQGYFTRKP